MAQATEAACLLESGATYHRRIGLRASQGDPIFAGFKHAAFSLYCGDAPIYHFDLEGRWQRAFVEGTHYLKGLDTTTQAIDRVREGANLVLRRRTLDRAEAAAFDERVRSHALGLIEALDGGRLEPVGPPPGSEPLAVDELRGFLERIAGWDAAAWRAHREQYQATYGPLPFLPPDCLNAVVLQATLGHAEGWAFELAKAAAHSVRSPAEFEEHARAVARLLGRRAWQCRDVFLGGSDVLRRPADEVAAYLESVARVFPVRPGPGGRGDQPGPAAGPGIIGIHAFLDDYSPPRPDGAAWRRLASLHLHRVSLGVESGDPHVRALFGKGWRDDDLRRTVADLKGAGLGVGLVLLVGAGGVEHAERHLQATAALINSLALGPGDLVALLDAHELRDPDSDDRATREVTPLKGPAWLGQQAQLKELLGPVRSVRKAKVVPYNLEKQGIP
jgi:hypothetical protein